MRIPSPSNNFNSSMQNSDNSFHQIYAAANNKLIMSPSNSSNIGVKTMPSPSSAIQQEQHRTNPNVQSITNSGIAQRNSTHSSDLATPIAMARMRENPTSSAASRLMQSNSSALKIVQAASVDISTTKQMDSYRTGPVRVGQGNGVSVQ
jgi:hypothetical protein